MQAKLSPRCGQIFSKKNYSTWTWLRLVLVNVEVVISLAHVCQSVRDCTTALYDGDCPAA